MNDFTNTCNDCVHCRKALWCNAGWIPNKAFGTCMHEELAHVNFVYRVAPLGSRCPLHEKVNSVQTYRFSEVS